jgi:hypothetical protein
VREGTGLLLVPFLKKCYVDAKGVSQSNLEVVHICTSPAFSGIQLSGVYIDLTCGSDACLLGGPRVAYLRLTMCPAPSGRVEPEHPKVEPAIGVVLGSNLEWYIGGFGGTMCTCGTRL